MEFQPFFTGWVLESSRKIKAEQSELSDIMFSHHPSSKQAEVCQLQPEVRTSLLAGALHFK